MLNETIRSILFTTSLLNELDNNVEMKGTMREYSMQRKYNVITTLIAHPQNVTLCNKKSQLASVQIMN